MLMGPIMSPTGSSPPRPILPCARPAGRSTRASRVSRPTLGAKTVRLLTGIGAILGLVAACGTTISTPTAQGGSCKPSYVACALLDTATVNAALPGLGFGAGSEVDMAASGARPNSFACRFGGSDPATSFTLNVACNPGDLMNGSVVYDAAKNLLGGVNTPVSDLGDYAFWHTPGADASAGGPEVLAVFFGSDGNLALGVTLAAGSSVDVEAGLRQLAGIVLPRL
ncbi:MAG: hypothetical protein JOZ69_09850 [Myxococcales bacterium]|nr:hypothetical protein [Myxococcales bacterium]